MKRRFFGILFIMLINLSVTADNSNCKIIQSGPYKNVYDVDKSRQDSPDLMSFAFVSANKSNELILVKDGQEIVIDSPKLYYSPDGKGFAYTGNKDGKDILVINGKEIGKYDGLGDLIYSPDGKSLSFKSQDAKYIVSNNGENIIKTNIIKTGFIDGILYSPDGKSSAYIKEQDGKQIVVKDGVEINKNYKVKTLFLDNLIDTISNQYDRVGSLMYSPDSSIFLFIAKKDGKDVLVMNGKELNTYDYIWEDTFIWSPDGKGFLFNAEKDGKWLAIKDGKESGSYSVVNFLYSPDGKGFAYTLFKDTKTIVIKDGKEISKYDSVGDLIYSPDGKSLSFKVERSGKSLVVKDGKEIGEYDSVGDLIYSPDGKSLSFRAERSGKSLVVKDDKEFNTYDDVESPIFSLDGKYFMFHARKNGKKIVVKNGIEQDIKLFNGNTLIDVKYNGIGRIIVQEVCEGENNAVEKNNIKNDYLKQYELSKKGINESNYKKYIPQLDNIVDNLSIEKANLVLNKIYKMDKNKLGNKKNIIDYIESKIYLKIN